MTGRILDGNAIAASIRSRIAAAVAERRARDLRPPGVAVLLVGDDPPSEIYVRLKQRDCREVGFKHDIRHLSANTRPSELSAMIDELNADDSIDGILVQLPLPPQFDASRLLERIDPAKDVDGVHPYNIGCLALRRPTLRSCTPKGIMTLLEHTGREMRGLDATIVGASNHVGRPMTLELLLVGCTVTSAHKFSRDTASHVATADVVISATGQRGLIRGDWIKPGAIVIDVGITRREQQALRRCRLRGGPRARRMDHAGAGGRRSHDAGIDAGERTRVRRSDMTALFVSDLHIDAERPHVLQGLKRLVEREAPSADALYILGDLVEVWIGDDDDSEIAQAVREALSRAARLCPLRIMHGNRDFLFGQRFARDVGGELIDDPHVAEIDGQRVLLTHGDALCTADTAYQFARPPVSLRSMAAGHPRQES